MVIVPAVFLGGVVIFFVVTFSAILAIHGLGQIKFGNKSLHSLDDDTIATIGYVTGGIAVGLLIISLFYFPRETVSKIWGVVTGIGIVFGIFTFFLKAINESNNETIPRSKKVGSYKSSRADYSAYEPLDLKFENDSPNEWPSNYDARIYRDKLKEDQRLLSEIQKIKDDLFFLICTSDNENIRDKKLMGDLLQRLFDTFEILVVESFRAEETNEAGIYNLVKGGIVFDRQTYLVELVWSKSQLETENVSHHLSRLFASKFHGSILISNCGFNYSAIKTCQEALPQKCVVLCELKEIVTVLEQTLCLKDFLRKKISASLIGNNPFVTPMNSKKLFIR
jgi:hypothetical protein